MNWRRLWSVTGWSFRLSEDNRNKVKRRFNHFSWRQ